MAENSAIEWTDHTFNPWIGCTKVSPACDNCYAERDMSTRLHIVQWGAGQPRQRTGEKNWNWPGRWNRRHEEFFAEHGRRQRVFCASLADVFDNEVPVEWRVDLFRQILATPNLDWLLLTKRIGNVEKMVAEVMAILQPGEPVRMPPNVWLGSTIPNQTEADRDVAKLLAAKAALHISIVFLSMEPLLGPVRLDMLSYHTTGMPGDGNRWTLNLNALDGFRATSIQSAINGPKLDWIIIGGESGPKARMADPAWYRSLVAQAEKYGTPILFKQWGEWAPPDQIPPEAISPVHDYLGDVYLTRAGKKAAGRMLDGRLHNGYPRQEATA